MYGLTKRSAKRNLRAVVILPGEVQFIVTAFSPGQKLLIPIRGDAALCQPFNIFNAL